MPKVSVIIPTYNRKAYVCETVESVLSQTYKDYEIIVVDDGSTDNTGEVLTKYAGGIRYIYQSNRGLSVARNRGIAEIQGEYVAFLDSDDLWLPNSLEVRVETLDNNPGLAFVCSDSYVVDERGVIINTWVKGVHNHETFKSLFEENFILLLTVMVRRSALLDVGFFDEELLICQDYDLWLRLARKYNFSCLRVPLAKYRIHPGNMSKNLERMMLEHKIIAKKYATISGPGRTTITIKCAKEYYLFAKQFYGVGNFSKAGICYLKSVLNFPCIGYYYWPPEAEKFRFSLPYRVLKIYYLIVECMFRSLADRCRAELNKFRDLKKGVP